MKLNPVSFKWKENDDDGTNLGLIAQELKTVLPEVVRDWQWKTDSEGETSKEKIPAERLGVFYSDIIPVLIKGIQEQQQIIQTKTEDLNAVKNEIAEMRSCIEALCNANELKSNAQNTIASDVSMLEQNTPNPFIQKTVIRFYIPENSRSAEIKIYSLDGSELKSIMVSTKGFGETEISGNTFTAGTYNYKLVVDGKAMGTKQMVLTK